MKLSKKFALRLANKLTHHDLIVIEDALGAYYCDLRNLYISYSKAINTENSSVFIENNMRSLCRIYDSMIDVRTVSKCFSDIRKEDFKTKAYEISSGS